MLHVNMTVQTTDHELTLSLPPDGRTCAELVEVALSASQAAGVLTET